MADVKHPRAFLEQRGSAERWDKGRCVQSRGFQIMIDLDDLWPTLAGAADMVSRLEPQREAHNARYANEHRNGEGWSRTIVWSQPMVAWYYLPPPYKLEAA